MCWPERIWRKVVRAMEEGEITDQYWRSAGTVLLERVYDRFGKKGWFECALSRLEGCCL